MKGILFLLVISMTLSVSKSKPLRESIPTINNNNINTLGTDYNNEINIVYRNELTQFLGIMKDVIIEKIFSSDDDDEKNSANTSRNVLYTYLFAIFTAFYFK